MGSSDLLTTESDTPIPEGNAQTAADLRRQEILLRAAELFDKSGYHLTSMTDIAESVGIRKPSLYHYFTTKDEILFHIHADYIDVLLSRQLERIRLGVKASVMIEGIIRDLLEMIHERKGHVRAYYEHHRELSDERKPEIVAKREQYRKMVEDAVNAGVAEGDFRDVNPVLTTQSIIGAASWVYHWYGRWDLPIEEIGDGIIDILFNGLKRA